MLDAPGWHLAALTYDVRVIARTDLRRRPLDTASLRQVLPRGEFDVEAALDAVRPICEQVHHGGADALRELGGGFDGVAPHALRVPADALHAALEQLDGAVRAALQE